MPDLKWKSSDGNYEVEVDPLAFDQMTAHCRKAAPNETGGILAGFYSRNLKTACVTIVSQPPIDSKSGRTWFQRGIAKMQTWLRRIWDRQEQYYLGEWHYHPAAQATASEQDRSQMMKIAQDPNYACPEPILMIIGGSEDVGWSMSTFVVAQKQFIELVRQP